MLSRILFLSLVATWVSAQTAAPARNPVFDGLDKAIAQLAEITGLEPLKKVQYDTITKAGVQKFLEERIKEEVTADEIRLEEIALKRFGLVPEEFDLRKTTLDLLTEQAAAFYDYKRKKLFVLEQQDMTGTGVAPEFQQIVLVHELAHALADQHFDLGKFIKRGSSDDSALARMAVMEGQASWLMMEFAARKMGQSLLKSPQMIELMGAGAGSAMAAQYPVLAKAPLYIRQTLLFPYTGGMSFQHAVVEKNGKQGFSQVFRQPPSTSQQVLHPDKYLSRVEPVKAALPELARPKEWTMVLEGTTGEFDHAILLEQYLSKKDAEELAPHWRGGRAALAEKKGSKRIALLYASEWDSPEHARALFAAYKQVLRKKWTTIKVDRETDSLFSGTGDHGLFQVTVQGPRLNSVEGLTTADEFRASEK